MVCLLYALHATLVNDTRCLCAACCCHCCRCRCRCRCCLQHHLASSVEIIILCSSYAMRCQTIRPPTPLSLALAPSPSSPSSLSLSLCLPTVRSSSFSFIRCFSLIRSFPFSFRVLNTRQSIQFSLLPLDSHPSSLRNCQKFQLRSFVARRVMAANHF